MNREQAILEWFNQDKIKSEQVFQLIRESFEQGARMGVRWSKSVGSHTLTSPKIGEALDEWCAETVQDSYLQV